MFPYWNAFSCYDFSGHLICSRWNIYKSIQRKMSTTWLNRDWPKKSSNSESSPQFRVTMKNSWLQFHVKTEEKWDGLVRAMRTLNTTKDSRGGGWGLCWASDKSPSQSDGSSTDQLEVDLMILHINSARKIDWPPIVPFSIFKRKETVKKKNIYELGENGYNTYCKLHEVSRWAKSFFRTRLLLLAWLFFVRYLFIYLFIFRGPLLDT